MLSITLIFVMLLITLHTRDSTLMKKIQKNIERITMVTQYLDGQISISSNMKLKIKKSLQVTEKVKSKTNKQVKVLRSNQVLMKASPTASEKETSDFKKS